MKKFSIFVLLVLAILLPSITGYCEDRYEYIGTDYLGQQFYVDTQSIAHTNLPNHFRFWHKVIDSDLGKNNTRLSNIAYVMVCIEVNFAQNVARHFYRRQENKS